MSRKKFPFATDDIEGFAGALEQHLNDTYALKISRKEALDIIATASGFKNYPSYKAKAYSVLPDATVRLASYAFRDATKEDNLPSITINTQNCPPRLLKEIAKFPTIHDALKLLSKKNKHWHSTVVPSPPITEDCKPYLICTIDLKNVPESKIDYLFKNQILSSLFGLLSVFQALSSKIHFEVREVNGTLERPAAELNSTSNLVPFEKYMEYINTGHYCETSQITQPAARATTDIAEDDVSDMNCPEHPKVVKTLHTLEAVLQTLTGERLSSAQTKELHVIVSETLMDEQEDKQSIFIDRLKSSNNLKYYAEAISDNI